MNASIRRRLVTLEKQISKLRRITPGELRKLLGISNERMRTWMEVGLLGERNKKVGRGKVRSFSRKDALISLLIREVMDITATRRSMICLSEMVQNWPNVISPADYMVLCWDGDMRRWHVQWRAGERPQYSHAFIVLPMRELMRKVDAFFETGNAAQARKVGGDP